MMEQRRRFSGLMEQNACRDRDPNAFIQKAVIIKRARPVKKSELTLEVRAEVQGRSHDTHSRWPKAPAARWRIGDASKFRKARLPNERRTKAWPLTELFGGLHRLDRGPDLISCRTLHEGSD